MTVPSREMLAPMQVSVVDPATNTTITTLPTEDSSGDTDPHLSDVVDLAERVADRRTMVDPDHPAAVYYGWRWDNQGERTLTPVWFDLTTQEVKRIGPPIDGVPILDQIGEQMWFIGRTMQGDGTLHTYSADGSKELWSVPNVTDVCAASEDQLVVAANGQIAVLDRASGKQIGFSDAAGSDGIFSGPACGALSYEGFGWGIEDDITRGNGGQIVSWFDQSAAAE